MTGTAVVLRMDEQKRKEELRAKRIANLRMWKPGQSGNPRGGGVPAIRAREFLKGYAPEAMARLISIMRGKDEALALDAIKILLERAYGKAVQPQAFTDVEGNDRPIEGGGQVSELEIARRIAFLLTRGMSAASPQALSITAGDNSP